MQLLIKHYEKILILLPTHLPSHREMSHRLSRFVKSERTEYFNFRTYEQDVILLLVNKVLYGENKGVRTQAESWKIVVVYKLLLIFRKIIFWIL